MAQQAMPPRAQPLQSSSNQTSAATNPPQGQQAMAKPVNSVQPMQQNPPTGNPSGQPSPNVAANPSAQEPQKTPIFKKWWFWLIIVLGILIIGIGGWWIFLK